MQGQIAITLYLEHYFVGAIMVTLKTEEWLVPIYQHIHLVLVQEVLVFQVVLVHLLLLHAIHR